MEALVYNINPKVYKTCDLSIVSAVAENPNTYQKDSDYPIVVRASHRTRVVRLNSGVQAIKFYRDKPKSSEYVDFRERKIIEAAGKASKMFRCGCGC